MAARGAREPLPRDAVRLDLPDVVKERAGNHEIGVRTHRLRHVAPDVGYLPHVQQKSTNLSVVAVDRCGRALEVEAEGLVVEEQPENLPETLRLDVAPQLVEVVP